MEEWERDITHGKTVREKLMSRAAIRCSPGQVTGLQTVSSGRKCPERTGRGPLEVERAGVLTKMWKHSGQLSPLLLFGCVTSPKFCL